MSRFPELAALVSGNQVFSENCEKEHPGLLGKLAKGQAPKILWIGCVDSRVPETVITNAKPGDIFVHRNIANQFQLEDDSANSVLEYALTTVGCTHVVVVGHSGCGGCIASFEAPKDAQLPDSALFRFIDPLIKFRHTLPEGSDVNDLIRENVKYSVQNVLKSTAIKNAWSEGKDIWVHGWHFDIASGLLHDLECSSGHPKLHAAHHELPVRPATPSSHKSAAARHSSR